MHILDSCCVTELSTLIVLHAIIYAQAFDMCVQHFDRDLVNRALTDFDSLTSKDRDLLTSLFGTFGMFQNPRKQNVKQLVIATARNRLLDQSAPFVEEMRMGIPSTFHESFWA